MTLCSVLVLVLVLDVPPELALVDGAEGPGADVVEDALVDEGAHHHGEHAGGRALAQGVVEEGGGSTQHTHRTSWRSRGPRGRRGPSPARRFKW